MSPLDFSRGDKSLRSERFPSLTSSAERRRSNSLKNAIQPAISGHVVSPAGHRQGTPRAAICSISSTTMSRLSNHVAAGASSSAVRRLLCRDTAGGCGHESGAIARISNACVWMRHRTVPRAGHESRGFLRRGEGWRLPLARTPPQSHRRRPFYAVGRHSADTSIVSLRDTRTPR